MRFLNSAAKARAGARLLAGLLLAISYAHAAPLDEAIARNAALPKAPLLAPALFDAPERLREVRLSPDGTQLAWLEEIDGKAELSVMPVAGGAARPLLALDPQDRIQWSRDGAVLFVSQAGGVAAIGVRDGAGGRIAAFPKDGSERLLGIDTARPRHVVLQHEDSVRGTTRLTSLAADGARSVLYDGPGVVGAWLPGPDGMPLVLRRQEADFRQTLLRRDDGTWREFGSCKALRTCAPLALSPDGKRLLLRTVHADDREALVEIALDSGARRLLHQDPQGLADMVATIPSPTTGQPMLAAYQLPALRVAGLDEQGRRIEAAIRRRFPEGGVLVESCAANSCLLAERGARLAHARFWLLDLRTHAFRPVLDEVRARATMPAEAHLAERIALRYPASDGTTVHGYLTLPRGLPARGLPLVTAVHGGPWGHVDGGYGPISQMLANRGFAVFEPNFRGSTGYGERYTLAPGADYGNGLVQRDIVDGVRWLLAQGVGDPKRLAIIGGSFGGYATLLALTHTPSLFRFGMAAQPTPDFAHTLRVSAAEPPRPGQPPFRQTLATLGIDPAHTDAIARDAPRRLADRVRAPLLVVASGKDEKIEVELVADYVATLQGLKKPVSVLVDPDEGHNPRSPVARRAQAHLLLRMLQRYLGGPPAPPADEEVKRYLARTLRADGAGLLTGG